MEKRPIQESGKDSAPRQTKIVVQSQFDPTYKGTSGVINNEPSMTVPDMSYTIQELMLNHSRGIDLNIKNYEGEYFDMEIPQFDDITERIAYRENLKEQIETLQFELDNEKSSELSLTKEESQTDTSSEKSAKLV